ncbi:LysR family transcriptional regulator [Companilactobacillus mishanensis]|uniref:LysR family transcriptional regulator n=1 Tax=Companilactobacillus mishanensis TaxID=2486008 RepID=A0A5P0ZJ83_9LACO|nr:LysR family transcriptional regulator [Companilactobacillus mishanensis]MQS53160.1 LysR family transcriptional regulator [Companilactobacillus mishanensis]
MLDKRYMTLSTLAETKSYTQAANQLFITQPAVSQQIKSLEDELNLKLVDVTNRKIKLTDVGKKLATYVKQIDLESSKVIEQLQNANKESSLKLGCTLSLSSTLLPQFISQLSSTTKVITTEINNTDHILQNIRDGKVDFGLIEGNFNKDEFDSIFLRKEQFICVTNPTVNLQSPTAIENIFDQSILVRERGSGSREIFENWLGTQNYQIEDFKHIVEIASPNVIIKLLEQNFGISFIYESLVRDEIKTGKLKRLAIKGFDITHPINLVFMKNSYFSDTYLKIARSIFPQANFGFKNNPNGKA